MKRPLLVLALLASTTTTTDACRRAPTEDVPPRVFPIVPPREPRVVRPPPAPALEPLLAELRGMDSVGGVGVGDGGAESTFHRIGNQILPTADASLLAWLAADDDPTLRALGLWGSALRGDGEALARHACDRDVVEVCPGGCICGHETIGEVALRFALAPRWLDSGTEGDRVRPLFGVYAELTMEVLTTALDACRPTTGVDSYLVMESSAWTWAGLRASVPKLPAWIRVKAIARRGAKDSQEELARVLEDASLPSSARLAAASGLTHRGGDTAEAAIGRSAGFLRAQGGGLLERFERELAMRRKVQAIVDRLRQPYGTWMETESEANELLEAYEMRHPVVLDLLLLPLGHRSRWDAVERARVRALRWVAGHLDEYRACWDAYRRTAYGLEWSLGRVRRSWLPATLTADERAEIATRVKAEVAILDADVRCRSY